MTREANWNDIDRVVLIHQQAFAGFFLTQLGAKFLEIYYATVLESAGGILLVAEGDESRSLAFVAGFTDSAEFYRRLKAKRLSIAQAVIFPVLRSPILIRRLFSSASLAGDRIEADENKATAELSSIAVADSGKGAGIGRLLLDYFCNITAQRGVEVVMLTTDSDENDSVNDFYSKSGFRMTREFVTSTGRRMNEYRRVLGKPSRPEQ